MRLKQKIERSIYDLLKPCRVYGSLQEISLVELKKEDIQGIIIDLDNTLTEWQNAELSEEVIGWLQKVKFMGFQVCLVSNNSLQRVREVASRLSIPFVAKAQKPRRKSFRQALEIMNTQPRQTAVIGDQLFTDVLGGNRLGLFTILVPPLNRREFIGTRLVRLLESALLIKMQKRDE